MDATILFLCTSVCGALTLIVYFFYTIGMKEKSFEEALEEQKKRSLEEEMQLKQEKGKKEKEKKFKKWNKRKEKNDTHESEKVEIPVHDSQTNEFVGDIEIVEPREMQPRRKGKGGSKSNSSKSESSPSSEDMDVIEILSKPSGDGKVNVEKKKAERLTTKEKEVPKVEAKEKELIKSKTLELPSVPQITEEPLHNAPDTQSTTPTKKKKKDVSDKATDVSGFTAAKLVQFLKAAELGDEESQMLIDVLLNKQKDASEWKKKNDPLATARKQLQEKEQALELEQSQRQTATSKLKELKHEYTQEKTKSAVQERLLTEKNNQQQQEIKSLSQRIKQIQEQYKGEKSSLQEKILELQSSVDEKHEATVKTLQDEKVQLQKALAKIESSARSKPSVTELETKLETVQKSKEDLQKVHALLVEQHTLIITNNKSECDKLNAQLSDARRMAKDSNEKLKSLAGEVDALKKSHEGLEAAKASLEQLLSSGNNKREYENLQALLEEAHGKNRALEAQVYNLSDRISDITQQHSVQIAQLQQLQQEKERLAAELATSALNKDKPSLIHQNGDINGKEKELLQKTIAEMEIILEDKEKLLQQINEELLKQRNQMSVLSVELEGQKQKNNELREKNWKTMEALSTTEKTAEQKLQEAQKIAEERISKVTHEYEERIKQSELHSPDKSSEEVSQLKDSCAKFQQEVESLNSELAKAQNLHRVAERNATDIEKTIKELKSEVTQISNNTKTSLQRIFPDISIDNSVPQDVWLQRFEEQAHAVLKASSGNSSQIDELLSKIANVEKEKEDLKAAVQHYKAGLADTESVLNRLQQSAEATESLWKDKLNAKEQELKIALKEIDDLIGEKEKLQSTIDQMGRLDEMQEKLKLLQGTIESAENDRLNLQLKYEEVNNNYINLQDQIKIKEQKILELQNAVASLESTQKELEDIKSKLEKERKISKDLSAQTVKLNSLVKIGQDSLKAEQDLVSQLKSQLEAHKSCTATANGTSSPSITVSANESRSKPSEKAKKSKK